MTENLLTDVIVSLEQLHLLFVPY